LVTASGTSKVIIGAPTANSIKVNIQPDNPEIIQNYNYLFLLFFFLIILTDSFSKQFAGTTNS
jgi:hypothetical protein